VLAAWLLLPQRPPTKVAPTAAAVLAAWSAAVQLAPLTIHWPLVETLFPPELPPARFRWEDASGADTWAVRLAFADGGPEQTHLVHRTEWTPNHADWAEFLRRSREAPAQVVVVGARSGEQIRVLSAATVRLATSADEVGAPIFYREVNLPFIDAVKDPSAIRWRFGPVSALPRPPVVLEGLPVCGNCHSFSADGTVLGMDVDYANDKGSYAIAPVAEEIELSDERIITWSDFRREDGEQTFGLLSQVSPDGRWVVSTVKDQSVFVPRPGLEFSQLFFPVKGILAVYDRETGRFAALPGADDERYVQTNPSWSPDGKSLVFARAKAHSLAAGGDRVLLSAAQCQEFLRDGRPFRFDLYRIPFADGAGGVAVPVEGASGNGRSNFFARFSPDGRWLVFTQAANYMLLQPDSSLHIVPAAGGRARRMRCNTERMNSWHSWSPNGRWLIFSSKVDGPYTKLLLTHVDKHGHDTPPVLLEHLTAPDRAANIPEFVASAPDAIRSIRQRFVGAVSFLRAADQFEHADDHAGAERAYRKALELDPRHDVARARLGRALVRRGRPKEALSHLQAAVANGLQDPEVHTTLGIALDLLGRMDDGLGHYRRALQLDPGHAQAHLNLGLALEARGDLAGAAAHHERALASQPDHVDARAALARALARQGRLDVAAGHYEAVLASEPRHVQALNGLGIARARQGDLAAAERLFRAALAVDAGDAGTRRNLAMALRRLGRHAEAAAYALPAGEPR